jgi:hypothetical protein
MKMKTPSEELEFGGSRTPIYGGFGVFETSPNYYTIYPLNEGELFEKKILPILKNIIV